MKKLLLLPIIGILMFTLAGCGKDETGSLETAETTETPAVQETILDTTSSTNKPSTTIKDEQETGYVAPEETTVSTTTLATDDIKVTTPANDATVSSPFLVSGEAKSADNKIYVKVRRPDNKIVIEEQTVNVKAAVAGEFGEFSINLHYVFNLTEEGTIEIYTKDDDTEEMLAKIPVKFE